MAQGVREVKEWARKTRRTQRGTWPATCCGMAGELAALKADARDWLTGPKYAVVHLRLENAHAAVEAALIEARRRVRLNEGQEGG